MQPGARCSELGNTFAKSPGCEQHQADEVLKEHQNTGGYIFCRLTERTHHGYAGEREHNQHSSQGNRAGGPAPFFQCSLSSKWSPTRSALAMIVSEGLTAPLDAKNEPSTT